MDLVITGANVLTMDSRDRRAEAVAVDGGKIAAVGTQAQVSKVVGPDTEVVHLAGRTLIPGFIDVHNHFSMTTLQPVMVDCRVPPHRSINSILDAISTAAKGVPSGRWIWGWGHRLAGLREYRRITRWDLDEVAPNNPVCVIDGLLHGVYANSEALKLAGISRETPNPPIGQILHDHNGEPDGNLFEQATDPLYSLTFRSHLDYYGDQLAELVYDNCMRHLVCGITSVGDALVVPEAAEMYRLADSHKKLPIVIHQMLGGAGFFGPPEGAGRGEAGDGNVSDRLRGGTIKLFMDHAFPRDAPARYHSRGYKDNVGGLNYAQDEADRLVVDAHKAGLQVAIHTLGTWAVERALNSIERAQREYPRPEPRHRIEHFFLPTLDQIKRARSLGVVAAVQPPFFFGIGEMMKRRAEEFGGDVRDFPFKTMLSEGIVVAGTSDTPAAPLEPLVGINSIVTRQTALGNLVSPEEAVSPMEALRMYTMNAAYAMSRDSEVGSLEQGKRADMAVLSHDPTAVSPGSIRDIFVERTYVEGKLLYQR